MKILTTLLGILLLGTSAWAHDDPIPHRHEQGPPPRQDGPAHDNPTRQHFWMGGGVRLWNTDFDADFSVFDTNAGLPRTSIDLEGDLDVDVEETTFEVFWGQRHSRHGYSFRIFAEEYEGRHTLTRTITYDDVQFTAGTDVESEFGFVQANSMYEFYFLPPEYAHPVDFGLTVGLQYIGFSGVVENQAGTQKDRRDEDIIYPVFGARLRMQPHEHAYIQITADGTDLEWFDNEITTLDAAVEIGGIFSHISFGIGYRYHEAEFEADPGDTEINADWTIEGMYLHVGVQF
jgi:hypothetical protein